VDDGLQIRLGGEGEPGERGGPPGNLYVVISVEAHEFFQRRGHDIILDLPVNVAQAALGDMIAVPTVDGEEEVQIKPGIQTGAVIRLRGKGVPKLRRDGTTAGRGDQLIVLNVEIPTKLTDRQRELFRELGETLGTEVKPKGGKGLFERVADFFNTSSD
jgi:molecular chaperone DnaJ